MKNFTIPSPFKKAVFTVFVAAMGMLSISWTEDKEEVTPNQQSASYQVINQKAFIAGAGKLKDWKSEVSNFDCTGQFVAQQGELGSISDFSFSLNIADLNNAKEGSELQKAISTKGINEIVFMQKKLMILPIMKMVYMGGEVTMKDGSHASPIYLSYELDENQNIKVTGKQHVRLSEFGIKAPNIDAGALEDEIIINIEFTLAKPQFASTTVKMEPIQLAARPMGKRADTRD